MTIKCQQHNFVHYTYKKLCLLVRVNVHTISTFLAHDRPFQIDMLMDANLGNRMLKFAVIGEENFNPITSFNSKECRKFT